MKKLSKIISYILSVILGILIILLVIIGYIHNDILSETTMKTAMGETNYYYSIYSIIQNSANDNVMQSGFHEIVLKDVITEQQVQKDIDNLIDAMYNNKNIDLSADKIKETLHNNIKKQIQLKGYEIDENTQSAIDEFEKSVIDEYTANICYSQDVVNLISKYLKRITQIVNIAVIVLGVTIILLVFAIYKLNKPAIGISFIVPGVFFVIMGIYSGVNVAINNILIINWAFSKTMIYIMNGLMQKMFITGIILTIVGIIISLLGEYKMIKDTNKKREM